jgi:cytoskeletal protein CcmA (bactofilin family)
MDGMFEGTLVTEGALEIDGELVGAPEGFSDTDG